MAENNSTDTEVRVIRQEWMMNEFGRSIDPTDIIVESNRGRLILVNVVGFVSSDGEAGIRHEPVSYKELTRFK